MNSMDMVFNGKLSTSVEKQVLAISLRLGLQPSTVGAIVQFLKVLVNEDPLVLVPVLALLTPEEVEDISNMLMEILAHTHNKG